MSLLTDLKLNCKLTGSFIMSKFGSLDLHLLLFASRYAPELRWPQSVLPERCPLVLSPARLLLGRRALHVTHLVPLIFVLFVFWTWRLLSWLKL